MVGSIAIGCGMVIVVLLVLSFITTLLDKQKLSEILLKLTGFVSLVLIFLTLIDVLLQLFLA